MQFKCVKLLFSVTKNEMYLATFLFLPTILTFKILPVTSAFKKQVLENLSEDRLCHLILNFLLAKVRRLNKQKSSYGNKEHRKD